MHQEYLFDEPIRLWQRIHPSIWAIVNLLLTAYGIFVCEWDFYLLIYVWWMELHLITGAMLIRVSAAREYKRHLNLTGEKLASLGIGLLLSTACITLTVAMDYDKFGGELTVGQFAGPQTVILLLGGNHTIRILLHYFQNKRFRKANPATEMIVSFVYQVGIVGMLIAITLYYLPHYPQRGGVKEVASTLLSVKLFIDLLYSGFHRTVIDWFTPPATLEKSKKEGVS